MDFDSVYLRVLKFLNSRPRSEKEVRDYIKRISSRHPGKFEERIQDLDSGYSIGYSLLGSSAARMTVDNGLIDLVVHKLKQQKFLNDKEFAKMWVRSRTQFKAKGDRLIRLELQQKGINKDTIDEAFATYDKDQENVMGDVRDEKSLAKELLEKKRKKYEGMASNERFNKAGSMLARRGFDLDDIKWAIDQVFGKMV